MITNNGILYGIEVYFMLQLIVTLMGDMTVIFMIVGKKTVFILF